MKRLSVTLLVLFVGFNLTFGGLFDFLFGGKKEEKKEDKQVESAEKKEVSDTLVELTIGEPDTLDLHHQYDSASSAVLYNIYDSLIEYDGEKTSSFLPRISENVPSESEGTITDGGKTYIFKIREGVKFQNGNDLTPEDVEYTFERALVASPDGSPMWMYFVPFFDAHGLNSVVEEYVGASWDEIFDENGSPKEEYVGKLQDFYKDKIDPAVEVKGNEVHIHLAKPFLPFLNIVAQYAGWSGIMDKEWSIEQNIWDGTGEKWWEYHNLKKEDSPIYDKAMGSGPYALENWDRAQKKVTLIRNDNYWRAPASIRKVIVWGVSEWSTRKAMLEKGEADIVYTPPEYLEQVRGMDGVVIREDYPTMTLNAIQFTWGISEDSKYIGSGKLDGEGVPVDFFEDINVRKGFTLVFDQDTFVDDVVDGLGFVPPTCLIKGLLGYNENLNANEYDLEKATEYFKKAYNGKLWNVGFKMAIVHNKGNDTRRKAAEIIAANLKQINPKFQVEVKALDWPSILDGFKNSALPAYVIGWGADYPDPDNFIFTYYHSSGDYGGFYGGGYKEFASTPQDALDGMSLNEIITKAANTYDEAERVDMYNKIQKFAIDQGIGIPILQSFAFNVISEDVKDYSFNAMRGVNYHEYYLYSK